MSREFVRFIEALHPLFFAIGNVPPLSSFTDWVLMEAVREDFYRIGYFVYPALLEAAHYCVPQYHYLVISYCIARQERMTVSDVTVGDN